MDDLQKLPNIGKVAQKLLVESGIETADELRRVGTKEAFMRIRLIDPTACLHMLYGIEGAVQGIRDTALPNDVKEDLRAFFNSL